MPAAVPVSARNTSLDTVDRVDAVHSVDAPASAEAPGVGFDSLGLDPAIAAVLRRQGITTAFPIQAATLPDSLAGRDVLGRGRTGSGKTLAFSLPVVTRLARSGSRRKPRSPRALVLTPTRELATQVAATIRPLAEGLGLRVAVVIGGVRQNPQVNALRNGVDIVVACPGRLEDLIGQGVCDLSEVEIVVLDEADHMSDLGFLPAVKRLLDATPANGQRMLFSATLDREVDVLVQRYLHDPVTHSVDTETAPPPAMDHHVFRVHPAEKADVIRDLAGGQGRSVLFTRTKRGAERLAKQLTRAGVPATDLHGDLSQGARQRNLASFSRGDVRVLVATDVAARGIHVDDVSLIVHVDPPADHKAYLHRSGRTARAGAAGTVVSLVTSDQRREVDALVRRAKIRPAVADVSAGSPAVVAVRGEAAALVEWTPEPVHPPRGRHVPGKGGAPAGKARSRPAAGGAGGQRRPATTRTAGRGAVPARSGAGNTRGRRPGGAA